MICAKPLDGYLQIVQLAPASLYALAYVIKMVLIQLGFRG